MACSIPYIQNATLSNTEKERLQEIHVQIFKDAKESKAFREVDNRLQAIKNRYNEATSFIGKINSQYGPISRLNSIGNGNAVLSVNVLPLSKEQQLPLLQKEGVGIKTSPKVVKLSKELLERIGVDYQKVKEIAVNGKKIGANGAAFITQQLVQVVEGKEAEALPEEAMHFVVEILEQKDPKLFTQLLGEINGYQTYKEVLADYSNDPLYKTKEGKPDIRKLKKEAIAKQLVSTIINKIEGTTETVERIAKAQSWWSKILEFIRNLFISSGFDAAAMKIISGEEIGTVDDIRNIQEPSLREGYTRLYRSEVEIGVDTAAPEWLMEQPEILQQQEAQGRWFYKTLEEAKDHANKFGSGGISYVDIPTSEVENYNAKENKFAGGYGREGREYFVSKDIASNRKSLISQDDVFLQKETQESLYNKLKDIKGKIEKKDETYYIEGKKISRRVTDLVKDWYSRRLGEKALTASEYDRAVYDLKAEKGTKGHADMEHAFEVLVDEDGFLRVNPLDDSQYVSQLNPENRDMYNILYSNLKERLHSFPEGTRFMSEITVYDPKRDIAGTLDLLAITPDSKVSVLDWKFMDLNTDRYDDVPWYKISAWRQQMDQYKLILEKVYNVESKDFQQTRMIPIKSVYSKGNRVKNILPKLLSIKIGDVNVKNIKDDYLLPVSTVGESTGNKKIDVLIEKLNAIYDRLSSKKVLPSEKTGKAEQLNSLFKAIRQLQVKQNVTPLIEQAKIINRQLELTIQKYKDSWQGKDPLSVEQAKISNFYEEIESAQRIVEHYTNLDVDLKFLFKGELSEEDQKLKNEIRDVVDNARDLQVELTDVGNEFVDSFVSGSEQVNNILSPEKIIKGLSKWFSSTSTLQIKALEVLYKKANRAFSLASMDTLDETKKLQKLKENYEKWASSKGLTQKNYFDFIKKKDKNELIDEFSPEFYKTLKDKIEDKDFKWIRENIDIPAYNEHLKEKLKIELQRIEDKARVGTEEQIKLQIIRENQEARDLYDTSTTESVGWLLYSEIRKFPKKTWETQEWKNLHEKGNEAALDFYNYIKKRNEYYREIGYLHDNQAARTFLPFVRKSTLERIVTGSNPGFGESFLRAISIDEGDVGYGEIDPLTGRPIDKVPVYFTREIDGEISTDLFRTMAFYNEAAIRYKHVSDIEAQARALINVERSKKAIATSMFGKTVYKNGQIQYTPDNNENTKLVEDMVKGIIYGQKFLQSESFDQLLGRLGSFGKKFNDKLGIKVFPENLEGRQISINKSIDQLNTTFQLNALGLNPLSSLSNLLGGTFQSIVNSGTYFTKADFIASEMWLLVNKMTGKDQKQMIGALEYFLPLTENYNREIAKKLSLSKLTQENIQDFLMILMRKSDLFVQTANFYSFLNNTIVEDGKLINVRELLRSQEKYQDMFSGTSEQRTIKRDDFEKEVKKLVEEKGVLKLAKIENEEFVIPGIDRRSESVIEIRRKIQQLSKDALGNLSEDDIRSINMNIYGKSFMIFKNWIPRLVDVRMGNLKYNSASDAYEWGRMRMVFRLLSQDLLNSLSSLHDSLLGSGDKWVDQMKKLYEAKKQDYETDTGKKLEMTESQFMNLVHKNVRDQLIDTLFMLGLFSMFLGLKALAPDDDEDDNVKNTHKFLLKAVDKIKDELWFFYDPTSFTSLVSSGIFPSISYINNLKRLVSNFGKEVYYSVSGNEDKEDKNFVLKYLIKTFPVSNQAGQILPIFFPEVAKDLGIRMSGEARAGAR